MHRFGHNGVDQLNQDVILCYSMLSYDPSKEKLFPIFLFIPIASVLSPPNFAPRIKFCSFIYLESKQSKE